MLTILPKKEENIFSLHRNGACKIVVDVISAVLDSHDAAAFATLNYGNGAAAEATESEEKGVKLLVVRFDGLYYVFFSFLCVK